MNILIDPLPRHVTVCGTDVAINADHRSCIRAHMALTDTEGTAEEVLSCFYPVIPGNWEEALHAELEFLFCDIEPTLPYFAAAGDGSTERAYSFLYDQTAILAAFWAQYRIDLTAATLHWWTFRALLNNLRGNNMADRIQARTARETADMADEQRKAIREARQRWRLPRMAQEQRVDDELTAALQVGDMGKVSEILAKS